MKRKIEIIFRVGGLIAVRQLWELGCNLYQLTREPFLTLKNIKSKKDKSQTLLIMVSVLTPMYLYTVGRVGWDLHKYGKVLIYSYGPVFLMTVVLELGLFFYLAYWSWRVIRNGNS